MRIGKCMQDVESYVYSHPGCPKLHPAEAVGPNGSRKYGYETVNRAIRAGLVRAEWCGNKYKLFSNRLGK
jgi:hypothetical protein